MRIALHPHTREKIDAHGYERAFGKPVDQFGKKRTRPYAHCGVCKQDVFLRAEHSEKRVANFAHREGTGFCPLKKFHAEAYRTLNPVAGNPQAAQRLKDSFFSTWQHHWIEFDRIIGYASIFDFCKVLKYANQHGIWHYRDMRVQDVLPVLLTLMDFPPLPKEKRRFMRDYGVRFFYEGSVANTGVYWNLPVYERSLVVVKYDFPGNTRTFQEDHASDGDPVEFNPQYLAGDFATPPEVHYFVDETMRKTFPNDVPPLQP